MTTTIQAKTITREDIQVGDKVRLHSQICGSYNLDQQAEYEVVRLDPVGTMYPVRIGTPGRGHGDTLHIDPDEIAEVIKAIRVGDRVRLTKEFLAGKPSHAWGRFRGVLTVTVVDFNRIYPVKATNEAGVVGHLNLSEIELVAAPQVGDRVKVVGWSDTWDGIGTIEEVNDNSFRFHDVIVTFDRGGDFYGRGSFPAKFIQPYVDPTPEVEEHLISYPLVAHDQLDQLPDDSIVLLAGQGQFTYTKVLGRWRRFNSLSGAESNFSGHDYLMHSEKRATILALFIPGVTV